MTYEEARVYLDKVSKYGSVLGLDAIRGLLHELGNPQDDLKFIHIAGTNGKGSVLAYTSTILSEAGLKTGRYVSPAVLSYLEMIQIDGQWISEGIFAELVEKVQRAVARMAADKKASPTVFEIETAIAFLYFRKMKCDVVVLETGLGGSLDATNIVKNTEIAVFAAISRDHMGFLGDTLEEIAENKAGIIKPGCTVVSASQKPEVRAVIEREAKRCGCPVIYAEPEKAEIIKEGYLGQTFSYKGMPAIQLGLAGRYQIGNAVTAYETVKAWNLRRMLSGNAVDTQKASHNACPCGTGGLRPVKYTQRASHNACPCGTGGLRPVKYEQTDVINGHNQVKKDGLVPEEAICAGFAKTKWQGRFTCILENPVFIVDGAHNEDAAKRLRESVDTYFPGKKLILIMGVFKDKEYRKIIDLMLPCAKQVYTVDLPDENRTLHAESLAHAVREALDDSRKMDAGDDGVGVTVSGSIEKAVKDAFCAAEKDDIILAFGSLSYLGRVIEAVHGGDWQKERDLN